MKEEIVPEIIKEEKEELVKDVTGKESKELDFTEEEAKVASQNITQLIDLLRAYQSPEAKIAELEKKKAEYEEGDYRIAQINAKIEKIKKKSSPDIIWNSIEKGTYVKGNDEETANVENESSDEGE